MGEEGRKKTRSKKMRSRKKKTRKTRNKRGGETPTQVEPQTTSTEISSEQTTLFNKLNDMDEAQLKEEYEKLGIPFPEIISTKAIAIQKLNLIEKAAKKLTTTTGTGDDQSIEEEQPDVTGTATTGTATT